VVARLLAGRRPRRGRPARAPVRSPSAPWRMPRLARRRHARRPRGRGGSPRRAGLADDLDDSLGEMPGVSGLPEPAPHCAPRRRPSPTAQGPRPQWAGAVAEAVSGSPRGNSTRWCWPATSRCPARRHRRPVAAESPRRALRQHVGVAVDGLVGATPELLVRREKGLVTSRVLAGTIRRTGDDGHDLALAASLARSSKDLEEHEYAVRSVADALAPALLVDERAGGAVRAAPHQRHASGDRRCRGARRRGLLTGPAASLHPRRRCAAPPRPSPTASSPNSSRWTADGMPGRWAGSTPPATASGASRCAAGRSTRPIRQPDAALRRVRHRRRVRARGRGRRSRRQARADARRPHGGPSHNSTGTCRPDLHPAEGGARERVS
jgi:hypothetical protein